MRSTRLALIGSVAALLVAGWLGAADAPPAPRALTLERITGEPPLVTPGMSGIAWRDGKRLTYIAREGTGAQTRRSLWEIDTASQKRTKLLDAIPLPEPGRDSNVANEKGTKEPKPRTLPLAGAQ